jgi:hypothetical protein
MEIVVSRVIFRPIGRTRRKASSRRDRESRGVASPEILGGPPPRGAKEVLRPGWMAAPRAVSETR